MLARYPCPHERRDRKRFAAAHELIELNMRHTELDCLECAAAVMERLNAVREARQGRARC